jgi:hypothetical protein
MAQVAPAAQADRLGDRDRDRDYHHDHDGYGYGGPDCVGDLDDLPDGVCVGVGDHDGEPDRDGHDAGGGGECEL